MRATRKVKSQREALKHAEKGGERKGHRRWFAGLSTRPDRVYLYVADVYAKTKTR